MRKAYCVAAALFLAVSANATDFSYSYVQLNSFDAKDSERDIESSGEGLTLSYQSTGGGFVQFEYQRGDIDELRNRSVSDKDNPSFGLVFGGARQFSDKLSLWTGAGVAYSEVETDIVTVNIYTYSMDLGLRYWLIPRVEVNGSVGAVVDDYGDEDPANGFDDDTEADARAEIGVRFYPLERLSIGAAASGRADGRTERYDVDLRWDY